MSYVGLCLEIDKRNIPTHSLFNQIETVSIYEDERGEAFTTYRFNKDMLVEIGFGSDYDWIDKKVKKNNIPTSNLTKPLI